jgi:hypothetical protein
MALLAIQIPPEPRANGAESISNKFSENQSRQFSFAKDGCRNFIILKIGFGNRK